MGRSMPSTRTQAALLALGARTAVFAYKFWHHQRREHSQGAHRALRRQAGSDRFTERHRAHEWLIEADGLLAALPSRCSDRARWPKVR